MYLSHAESRCVAISSHVAWSRLKKCHLDDVESLKGDLKNTVLQYRLARGSVRGAISEMKKQNTIMA